MDVNIFSLVFSIVGGTVAIVAAMIGMMLWVRSEANSDRHKFEQETKELRRDLVDVMRELKEDGYRFREEMILEMKDFHNRLCLIEERRK